MTKIKKIRLKELNQHKYLILINKREIILKKLEPLAAKIVTTYNSILLTFFEFAYISICLTLYPSIFLSIYLSM